MDHGLKQLGASEEQGDAGVDADQEPRAPTLAETVARRLGRGRGVPVFLLDGAGQASAAASRPTIFDGHASDLTTWLVEEVPLFEGMARRHIERIRRLGVVQHYRPGEFVFRHGERGGDLFIILAGTLEVVRRLAADIGQEALATLGPGQHFGEMAFLDGGERRSADVRVRDNVRLLRLPMRALTDLMFVDRDLAHALLWRFVRGLTRRIRESNDRVTVLAATARY